MSSPSALKCFFAPWNEYEEWNNGSSNDIRMSYDDVAVTIGETKKKIRFRLWGFSRTIFFCVDEIECVYTV